MQKLKLNVEELAVISFDVAKIDESRGTVHGAAAESEGCTQYCGATIFEYIWNRTWVQTR